MYHMTMAMSIMTSRMFAAGCPHSASRVPPMMPPKRPPPSIPWPLAYNAAVASPKPRPTRSILENTTAVPQMSIISNRDLAQRAQMGRPSATSTAI